MSRILSLLTLVIAFTVAAQPKKYFAVESNEACSKVHLTVGAKAGNYIIQPSKSADLINVYSNEIHGEGNYQLEERLIGEIQKIGLELFAEEERGLTRSISRQVLGDAEKEDCFWKVYLTEKKPYRLDLDYAVGNASLDLSGLAIENLNVNTGSADVEISYNHEPNKLVMDTFHVNVDLGSLIVKHIAQARSRFIDAEVGFGKLMLDFSDRPLVDTEVHGMVGAGNMIIQLPAHDVPVIVRVNDSWLSSVIIPDSFRPIGDHVFANPAYSKGKARTILFNLDVAMGRIILRERD
ncbi:MAG: hypothetical protein FJZ78_08465 [Bacteroidetes bacterium]|nr:hypothetical protein [Bacteroidota bacterium]